MKASLVRYISSEFKEGLRKIKVLVRGRNDTQTSFEATAFGDDAVPPPNFRAVHVETGRKGKTVIIGYINKNQLTSLKEGEKRIYSLQPDGETLSTFIYLKDDGTMEICGTGDFMVRYNELETAFNQLKADFDALVNEYNGHVHDGVIVAVSGGSGAPAVGTPGDSAPPTSQGDTSTADITPAKIEEITTKPVP